MLLEAVMICASLTVVDGDTVKCHNPISQPSLLSTKGRANQNLRLIGGGTVNVSGIDAPEKGKRAKCDSERSLSETASHRLAVLLSDGVTRIEVKGVDVFGRPLVNIYVADGSELGHTLLTEGYVKTWNKGVKNNWCNN